MKSIIESIIGRKGTSKLLRSFKDLKYGDVIELCDEGVYKIYIYIPMNHLCNFDAGGFVQYNPESLGHFSYWQASHFEHSYPLHNSCDVIIHRYVTHISEWQSISNGDDIKKLFKKYNIPINETY